MTTVPPAFILSRDLPEDPMVDNYELGVAIAKVVGRGGLLGVQRIRVLWRIIISQHFSSKGQLVRTRPGCQGDNGRCCEPESVFGRRTRWNSDPRNATKAGIPWYCRIAHDASDF